MGVQCRTLSLIISVWLRQCLAWVTQIAFSSADRVFAVNIVLVGMLGDDAEHQSLQCPHWISTCFICRRRFFDWKGTSLQLHKIPISHMTNDLVHFDINTSGVGCRGILLVDPIIPLGVVLLMIRFFISLCQHLCWNLKKLKRTIRISITVPRLVNCKKW